MGQPVQCQHVMYTDPDPGSTFLLILLATGFATVAIVTNRLMLLRYRDLERRQTSVKPRISVSNRRAYATWTPNFFSTRVSGGADSTASPILAASRPTTSYTATGEAPSKVPSPPVSPTNAGPETIPTIGSNNATGSFFVLVSPETPKNWNQQAAEVTPTHLETSGSEAATPFSCKHFTDQVILFYVVIIGLTMFASIFLTVEVMNPLRCQQRDALIARGQYSSLAMGALLEMLFAMVMVAQYALLKLTDHYYGRSKFFLNLRLALTLLLFFGTSISVLTAYFTGHSNIAFYIDCIFTFCLALSSAGLFLYVPHVLIRGDINISSPSLLFKVRCVCAFFFLSLTIRAIFMAVYSQAQKKRNLEWEYSVAEGCTINLFVICGAIAALRLSNAANPASSLRGNTAPSK
jgi:hypothetical protein